MSEVLCFQEGKGLVLVSARSMGLPETINGKPCYFHQLGQKPSIRTYGSITLQGKRFIDESKHWVLDGLEPHVSIKLKNIFPGFPKRRRDLTSSIIPRRTVPTWNGSWKGIRCRFLMKIRPS